MYIVERRQKHGNDKGNSCSGMQEMHIQYWAHMIF
jgi:hypothetical protein